MSKDKEIVVARGVSDEMRTLSFIEFFNSRPSININSFSREVGFNSQRLIYYILDGSRSLTDEMYNKFLPVMKKYGYEESWLNKNKGE